MQLPIILFICILVISLFSLGVAFLLARQVLRADTGTAEMQVIASAI